MIIVRKHQSITRENTCLNIWVSGGPEKDRLVFVDELFYCRSESCPRLELDFCFQICQCFATQLRYKALRRSREAVYAKSTDLSEVTGLLWLERWCGFVSEWLADVVSSLIGPLDWCDFLRHLDCQLLLERVSASGADVSSQSSCGIGSVEIERPYMPKARTSAKYLAFSDWSAYVASSLVGTLMWCLIWLAPWTGVSIFLVDDSSFPWLRFCPYM